MDQKQRYEVAAKADVSDATVRRWEADPSSVYASNRRRIEQAIAELKVEERQRQPMRKARHS